MAQASRGRQARRAEALRKLAAAGGGVAPTAPRRPLAHPAAPWLLLALVLSIAGLAMIGGGMAAFRAGQQGLTDTLTPLGALLLATSSAPLVLSIVRLLAQPALPREQRCGRCQFYRPNAGGYQRGVCLVDRQRQPTTRQDTCERFEYSERAMVRDRLSAAPHVLGGAPKRP